MAVLRHSGGQPLVSVMPGVFYRGSICSSILGIEQSGRLQDIYELGDELGLGQFGKIRSCTDKVTGEVMACKSIAKDRLVTAEDAKSVNLEIEIMTSLSGHPNIVALKAVFEEEAHVHLVMELCAGGELFDRLQKQGRYSEPDAAQLFKHLMEVVKYCHDSGVVHRDLKPENILFATKSHSSPIKLADFGLATYFKPEFGNTYVVKGERRFGLQLFSSSDVNGQSLHGTVGSPFYIAPEVLSGGYDQAADVWSAGVILYILLSGVPPFWGQTKSRIFDAVREAKLEFPKDPWRGISALAMDLISKMLCTDPKKRPTSVQVLEHPWLSSPVEVSKHPPFRHNENNGLLCSSLSSLGPETNSSFRLLTAGDPKIEIQPSFCAQSSFSGFLVGSQVSQVSGSFVFDRCRKSNGSDCSSLTPTILSFAFANVDGAFASEHSSYPPDNKMQSYCSHRESSFGHLFVAAVSNSIRSVSQYVMSVEEPTSETRKVGTSTSRYLTSHRGNRTIGLGELEQLDLKVSDSIIRWASCTRLSSATSFQSSLVC